MYGPQTKRQSKASGTGWFFDMVEKLAEKYSDDAFELAVAASDTDEKKSGEKEESGDSDKKSEERAAEDLTEELKAAEPPVEEPAAEASALELLLARAKAAGEGADRGDAGHPRGRAVDLLSGPSGAFTRPQRLPM